jgi:uncharacterized cupin superfamily protein
MGELVGGTVQGDGYALGSIDGMGDGPGFRKVRRELGVEEFGVNALIFPEGYAAGPHLHDEQEELYFVHQGELEFVFGDDGAERHRLGPGGIARVDARTIRQLRNVGDTDAIYICVGGKDGYVGRDGHVPEGEENRARKIAS